MDKYTVEELNKMSIYQVRRLAKLAGVSAPTKINKGGLVDLVYNISNGFMDPPPAPKRGRPRKDRSLLDAEAEKAKREAADGGESDGNGDDKENIGTVTKPGTFQPKQRYKRPVRQPVKPNYRQGDGKGNNSYYHNGVLNDAKPESEVVTREGFFERHPDGYGFLRVKYCENDPMDAYISSQKIKQHGLRKGDYVKAICRAVQEDRPPAVLQVLSINGIEPELISGRKNFDDLVPVYPDERIRLELPDRPREYAIRCIDLVSPIGKGQRGIIVSPPKAGKTTLLKMIATAITQNYPDVELKVLLIDERPEEVTDMQRSIKGEVVYSTFDELPEHHTKTAEMLLERSKRLVEMGKDVVILLDSLTRLARAYNLTVPPTGRTLSGGIDPGALHSPKRFFGSARNLEDGGSLTIIATALIDTGSRMDDVIFEEFKGTGNMEIHLDRSLSEKRIFPAIDLAKSGTRKEELLLTPEELEGTWAIRKLLSGADNAEATSNLLNMIVKTTSNKEFITQLSQQLKLYLKEGFSIRGVKPTINN